MVFDSSLGLNIEQKVCNLDGFIHCHMYCGPNYGPKVCNSGIILNLKSVVLLVSNSTVSVNWMSIID